MPGTRRQDLIGQRGLRDLDSLNMIADDLYLMKFRGSDPSGVQDYWTIIDKKGQIQKIPEKAKQYLTWSYHVKGNYCRQMSSGCLLVLCGGEKRVISFEADKAYKEKKIVAIRFENEEGG